MYSNVIQCLYVAAGCCHCCCHCLFDAVCMTTFNSKSTEQHASPSLQNQKKHASTKSTPPTFKCLESAAPTPSSFLDTTPTSYTESKAPTFFRLSTKSKVYVQTCFTPPPLLDPRGQPPWFCKGNSHGDVAIVAMACTLLAVASNLVAIVALTFTLLAMASNLVAIVAMACTLY